jgi:PIN domain nuclease of toxin-antitoxin system
MDDPIARDTHSLIWYLIKAPTLSARARAAIEPVFLEKREAILPTLVLAEMQTVIAKHRMSVDLAAFIESIPGTGCRIVPFDEVVLRRYLSLRARLDIFDRIIVATALVYNAPLVTRDPMIVASATVPVVW